MLEFLDVARRAAKPRSFGLTHVLDKGLGLRQMYDMLETAGEYIDILKLGWGTGFVTCNLQEKVAAYKQAGIPVCFGGTLLEVAIVQERFEDYCAMVRRLELTHVEFSTGVIEIELERKAEYVNKLAQEFTVLAEVGRKDAAAAVIPSLWIHEIDVLLQAGAWKVIAEARESGTVGLYTKTGEAREGLIDDITARFKPERLIFEAPQKSQQVWFIKQFGAEVNLGNIATDEVIALETLRLGLRGDTLPMFHLRG
jgi:phosphosulfolactate synthase